MEAANPDKTSIKVLYKGILKKFNGLISLGKTVATSNAGAVVI